ncbi:MAG: TonB-dependent receptor domain-containing protein, partial [Pyrinomonadaceae bacterium]
GGGAVRSVAPLAWRQGDFSGVTATIRDPLTGLPFAGNRIDPSRFSSVAKALLSNPGLYPLPNRTGNTNNYATTFANQIDGFQFDIKMDARLSEKDILSGRYSMGRFTELGTQGPLPTELTGKRLGRPQNIALNWTHTFSPTLINEARVGFNRALFIVDALDWAGIGDANATLGIPGGQVIPGLSAIRITGLNDIGVLAVTERNVTNTFHYGDNLTMIKGRHALKMGGQLQRYQQNRFYPGNNGLLGFFNYGSTFTGHAFADFLLDTLSSKGIGSRSGTWGHRQNRLGIFFQDDYKVRPNLTLNLGMRWEYASPIYEVKDRQSSFDIITGRQLFAGRDGNSRALYDPYYKAFEPRIGFAWTPNRFESKLVVRAGYGIVQFQEGTGANLRLPLNPPLFSEADRPFDTTTGPGRIALGFTDVIVRDQPAGLIRIWNPKLRPQFTQQWNLTLEHQLTNTMSVSAAYVGNKATNLIAPTDWNQPLPGIGPPSTWLPAQQRRPLFSALPLVTAISGTDSWSRSNYHSGQFSARQRFTRGLQFLASYTFGKVLTDNRGFYGSGVFGGDQGAYASNAYNREADYGPAFFDVKHNFVLSGTYELPIGKGRAWGNNWHPAAHALLGGWNISSIIQARTGFPITVIDTRVTASSLQAPRAGAFPRPNRIGSGQVSNRSIDQWIDSSAFVQPPLGQFGDSGVGILRGPSFTNWDFSIGKKFYWTEQRYFDLRTEFFNILNHPNFTQPVRDLANPTFGRINNTLGDPRRLELAVKFYF